MHNLSKEQLAARQVEVLDIASTARDYWSYAIASNSIDFSKFKSKSTGRGPLLNSWQVCIFLNSNYHNTCKPNVLYHTFVLASYETTFKICRRGAILL